MGSIYPSDDAFDFIICGGGTAGCVVAGRLAEVPDVRVLVIEAGPDSENIENVHMAGGWGKLTEGEETDWHIVNEPHPAINNRTIRLSRGKFLGGSSGCNGTLCVRGSKQNYDDWNMPGWSGEEMFRYMRKAEKFEPAPWFKERAEAHGYDGHILTAPHKPTSIGERIQKSMESKGLPFDADMFSHGEIAHGCGYATRTVEDGLRSFGAAFITKENKRDNVVVLTKTHVDKVIIEGDTAGDGLKAVGVRAVASYGRVLEFSARKEVIVCGGSLCSPVILNRSGIGAKEELEKHGIKTLVDLPGIGKNLSDHLIIWFYEAALPELTLDHLFYYDGALQKTYQLWKDEKKGALAQVPFGVFAFSRLDERLQDSELWNSCPREPGRDPMGLRPSQPNIEFFTVDCYALPRTLQVTRPPKDGEGAFGMVAELFNQRSRGTVSLRSADPLALPVVDSRYLTDPLDVEVFAEACRFGNEIIVEGAGTKDIIKGSWPPEASHHKYTSREKWASYVRDHSVTCKWEGDGKLCYHPGGTCAMGKASDPKAVVDEKLRVRGVRGLRVADVSIMPKLNGGHTQMPAYGIGEKAADMIKAAWGLQAKI